MADAVIWKLTEEGIERLAQIRGFPEITFLAFSVSRMPRDHHIVLEAINDLFSLVDLVFRRQNDNSAVILIHLINY